MFSVFKVASRSLFFKLIVLAGLISGNLNAQTMLLVGDSLSAAYQINPDSSWVKLLTDRLSTEYPDVQFNNASFGGATTASAVQRLPSLLEEFQPDTVIIELGGNDGLQGKPLSYIADNLSKIIKLTKDFGARPVLIAIRIPPNYGSRYTVPFFNQYEELAKQYNALYVPFILDGIVGEEGMIKTDGIHPTEAAQPLILDNIWPYISKIVIEDQS